MIWACNLDISEELRYINSTPPLGEGIRIGMSNATFTSQNTVWKRLKTIEGHLKGILRMVEQDAYCMDVIRQIQAVEAALNKVSAQILEEHLNSCVITAVRGNSEQERERVLKEIAEVFEMANKI